MPRYNDLTNGSVNYGADVRQRVINVDAAYRETPGFAYNASTNPNGNRVTDFLFKLTTPVRNVHEIRIVSVELGNITFAGSYLILQVNDESSIESKGGTGATTGTEITGVAKIQKPATGTVVGVTDSTGLITYPVTFRNPKDITVLRVRLVNPNGTVAADAGSGTVSFTLELSEVVNSYLYESQRKHIGYDPANVKK
jgi:hypothetical protein